MLSIPQADLGFLLSRAVLNSKKSKFELEIHSVDIKPFGICRAPRRSDFVQSCFYIKLILVVFRVVIGFDFGPFVFKDFRSDPYVRLSCSEINVFSELYQINQVKEIVELQNQDPSNLVEIKDEIYICVPSASFKAKLARIKNKLVTPLLDTSKPSMSAESEVTVPPQN